MEDTYILIYEYNPILSYIYPEQDSERRGYELQPPNLSAMAQDHMRVSYQSKVSPQSQHYMKEGAEGVSILMIIHFLITLLSFSLSSYMLLLLLLILIISSLLVQWCVSICRKVNHYMVYYNGLEQYLTSLEQ